MPLNCIETVWQAQIGWTICGFTLGGGFMCIIFWVHYLWINKKIESHQNSRELFDKNRSGKVSLYICWVRAASGPLLENKFHPF